MTLCFVDTMTPASVPQAEAWECFLRLDRAHQNAARIMFRMVCCRGTEPASALTQFVAATSFDDGPMLSRLEVALNRLAEEFATGCHSPHIFSRTSQA